MLTYFYGMGGHSSARKGLKMASVTTDIGATRPHGQFGDKIMHILEGIARISPTYRSVDALSRMTDADLAAQGLTRQGAAERIFGSRFHL